MKVTRSTKGYNFEPLSWEVLGACIEVQRQLGRHCMEVDYQRALALELRKRGVQFQREVEIPIEDMEQCLLYLKNGGYRVCLLVNFGEKPIGRKRIVHAPEDEQH